MTTPTDIARARAAARLTQDASARLMGVSLRQWQRWEAGTSPMKPEQLRLYQLATSRSSIEAPPSFQHVRGRGGSWVVRRAGKAWELVAPGGDVEPFDEWRDAYAAARRRARAPVPEPPPFRDPDAIEFDGAAISVDLLTKI